MSAENHINKKKIVIIGAGPTGLGAALRCEDLGHKDWTMIDCADLQGGLSRTYIDDKGFYWDLGGHVIFSHYAYFDDAMNYALKDWYDLQRESWVWVRDSWVPYPFQNNIHRLPNDAKISCLEGLIDVHNKQWEGKPQNFEEYFNRQFGPGISDLFMSPYNFKVWAVPPKMMSTEWTGERVATVDLKRVSRNIIKNTDDVGWGPNATFRFPKFGGTGAIWSAIANKLPQEKQKIGPQYKIKSIDAEKKVITLNNGETVEYDTLLSTMAIDDLLHVIDKNDRLFGGAETPLPEGCVPQSQWPEVAKDFVFSSTNVVGLGIKGKPPAHLNTMCWMYFPESTSPFYRCTVFSNYSPHNAPEGHWSLMLEVSESTHKPVNLETIIEECVQGCLASNLLTPEDVIVSKWHHRLYKGYPTPFIGRNDLLGKVQPALLANEIYSRGRFGGWKYEVGNQDHSMMQGVEAIEAILGVGKEITYFEPNVVNATKEMTRRLSLLKE